VPEIGALLLTGLGLQGSGSRIQISGLRLLEADVHSVKIKTEASELCALVIDNHAACFFAFRWLFVLLSGENNWGVTARQVFNWVL